MENKRKNNNLQNEETRESPWIFIIVAVVIPVVLIVTLILLRPFMTTRDTSSEVNKRDEISPVQTTKTPIKTTTKQNTKITLSDEEYDLLVRVVYGEAGGCSQECQRDVASVVINRWKSEKWGKSITDVIYYRNAFEATTKEKFLKVTPTKSCYDAVDYVLNNGETLPKEVRYFRSDYDFKWEDYKNYKVIDNLYFGYFENWRNGQW